MSLRESYTASRLARLVNRGKQTIKSVSEVYERSTLKSAIDQCVWITNQSAIVGWLTTEPDPDVVVIDLRETYTVGPVIAAIERIAPPVQRAWAHSHLRSIVNGIGTRLSEAPIRTISIGLAVAVITSTVSSLLAGAMTADGLVIRTVLLLALLLGTQIRLSWAKVSNARTVRALSALVSPPAPAADESESRSELSADD